MQAPGAVLHPGEIARNGNRAWLLQALQDARARTLSLFAAHEAAMAAKGGSVPLSFELNPPLWELGHVGWFQEWWLARNPQRQLGPACDPDYIRPPSRLTGADALYDSGRVPHDTRWSLPMPGARATQRYLQDGLDETLLLLESSAEDDTSLYFFRLALFHEDMHGEAAVYMAQSLGLALPAQIAFPARDDAAPTHAPDVVRLPAGEWRLGQLARRDRGFAFDNELGAQTEVLAAFDIDAAPVTWERYLPFVDAGGYNQARWWTAEGSQWRERNAASAPRYLRKQDGGWQRQLFGNWQPLDLSAAAVHLTLHEAQAWCRWAGRRLPGEAEWECAAMGRTDFRWGEVWEWTADRFLPFPGFTPHPYRDYSAPWFGSRQVLRGGSTATAARMMHPKYRNFFTPDRNDVHAGFRSCG